MKSTDTLGGWYPGADRIGIPDTNYAIGNQARAAVVIHVMDGTLVSTLSWFASTKSGVSSHFGIDGAGNVKQFVSIYDTSYANGLSYDATRKCWIDPTGYPLTGNYLPSWQLLLPPFNPNRRTITIEREGRPADTPTPAMVEATAALLRWLAGQYPQFRPYEVGRTLIGHSHIAPRHRANCPGPNADLAGLAAAANAAPTSATVPGPGGASVKCSERVRAFYTAKGGIGLFGYAIKAEYPSVDAQGQPCTILVCERAIIKASDRYGVELALRGEASDKGWA